jgi:microsomal dipeptidase-like Zn-dependent dipeptidase
MAAAQAQPLDTSTDITLTTWRDETVRMSRPTSHTNQFGDALESKLIPKGLSGQDLLHRWLS